MSEQVKLWRGDFGNDYISRNEATPQYMQPLTAMWARMLVNIRPRNIVEVGANIGLNLRAIKLLSQATLTAVEPNGIARQRLVSDGVVPQENCIDGIASSLPFDDGQFDLSFTHGVLIHIHPDHLAASCKEVARVSKRYVLCSEYFSTAAREVKYRGQSEALFTRDFGKFYMETCPSLCLIDYGFFWTGAGCVDDMTWWLFEKNNS